MAYISGKRPKVNIDVEMTEDDPSLTINGIKYDIKTNCRGFDFRVRADEIIEVRIHHYATARPIEVHSVKE